MQKKLSTYYPVVSKKSVGTENLPGQRELGMKIQPPPPPPPSPTMCVQLYPNDQNNGVRYGDLVSGDPNDVQITSRFIQISHFLT